MSWRKARLRTEPYDMSIVDGEAWRWYWMGKSPRVRAAVEEYLSRYATPRQITVEQVAVKHGVTYAVVHRHNQGLIEAGLIPAYLHVSLLAIRRLEEAPP